MRPTAMMLVIRLAEGMVELSTPPLSLEARHSTARDQLRLLGKVARMYYEREMKQPQIAAQLNLSQPRVSRLLRQAKQLGIVRTVVTLPADIYTDLEDEVQEKFGLRDVVVVDADGAEGHVMRAVATAAANYLDVTLIGNDRLGVSSWSETLIAAVETMQPKSTQVATEVVQLLGGYGNSAVQSKATWLTERLAAITGASPVFLPAPSLVGTPALRRTLLADPAISAVASLWRDLTVALVGIGSLRPSDLIARSGNALGAADQEDLRGRGAVGDVCLRFFDAAGDGVASSVDERLIGISEHDLKSIPRRIGVAGGVRKLSAVRAALVGGWVNILVTDLQLATQLCRDE